MAPNGPRAMGNLGLIELSTRGSTIRGPQNGTPARGRGRCGSTGARLVRRCRSRRGGCNRRVRRGSRCWGDCGWLRLRRHRDDEARRILPMLVRNRIRDSEIDENGTRHNLGVHRAGYGTSRFSPIRRLAAPPQRIVGSTHGNGHRNGRGPGSTLVLEHAFAAAAIAERHGHRCHWVVC